MRRARSNARSSLLSAAPDSSLTPLHPAPVPLPCTGARSVPGTSHPLPDPRSNVPCPPPPFRPGLLLPPLLLHHPASSSHGSITAPPRPRTSSVPFLLFPFVFLLPPPLLSPSPVSSSPRRNSTTARGALAFSRGIQEMSRAGGEVDARGAASAVD
ncbi:hypothetical protein DFH09DRAFT_1302785 [Mycena vulgaris]|nr:hypothetical protein DFH09DRAFT_1302785 [Mycena vulgaris]